MIPEQLKRLLQPWLKQTNPSELVDYIHEQTQGDIALGNVVEQGVDLDAPTIGLELDVETEVWQPSLTDVDIDDLQSMHFQDAQPMSVSTFPEQRYVLEVELGRGGMATVWRAFDPQLHRFIALKKMHAEKHAQNVDVESFIVEAQITAQLQHPGIVPIHEMDTLDNGEYFFTMREVQGKTLQEAIQTVHRVSGESRWETSFDGWNLRRLMRILHSTCLTLAYAHDRGVVHQDIKPTNIMIGAYGEVLVVDWGIAKLDTWVKPDPRLVSVRTNETFVAHRKQAVSGTPQYMAPEQLQGDIAKVDGRTDMYALGVILFDILCEERPFQGPIEQILKHKYHNTTSPSLRDRVQQKSSYRPVPEPLMDICERAMAHSPSQRFMNMRQMAQAIQDWLDGVQQEEEARRLLEEVAACHAQIALNQQQILTYRQSWEALLLQAHDPDTIQHNVGWLEWLKVRDLEQLNKAQSLHIRHLCHSAQMAAPQVLETYQHLLELEYQDLMDVLATGNYHLIQKIQDRLDMMMKPLSVAEQVHWRKRIELDRRSRKSRVHVERTDLLHDVHVALIKHRWVTLVGMAGVGKTHLAWQLARQWHQDSDGVVHFLDVSGVVTASELMQALYKLLDMQQMSEDVENSLVEALYRIDGVMLIIDNAEQLNLEAVQVLHRIQSRVGNGYFLVTSRRPLLLSEEHEETIVQIQPLHLIEGVELLAQHCEQHLPNWVLEDEHRYWLVDIVRRVDGIPLALDLAGSRLSEMSLRDLHHHLVDRFAVLGTSGKDDRPTLYRAMQWSVSELPDTHQQLLFELSIFPEAFTVDMVHGIVGADRSRIRCLEMLEDLAQHQLVVRTIAMRDVQYALLTSVREFSLEQLVPIRRQELIQSHARYFADQIAQRPILPLWGTVEWQWLSEHTEHCLMAAKMGDSDTAQRCAAPILLSLLQRGPWYRALELVTQLTQRSDIDEAVLDLWLVERLKMLDLLQDPEEYDLLLQTLHQRFNDWTLEDLSLQQQHTLLYFYRVEAHAWMRNGEYQKSEPLLRKIHDWHGSWTFARDILEADPRMGEMLLEGAIAWSMWLFQGGRNAESIQVLEPIVHLYHRQGWQRHTALAANCLGNCYHKENKSDKGLFYMDMALQIFIQLGNVSAMNTMEKIGMCYQRQGAYEQALSWFERASEAGKHHHCYEGSLYCNMGSISIVLGDYAAALEQYHEGMRIFRRKRMRRLEAIFLCNLAIVHHMLGQFEEAERLFLEDIELSQEMGLNGHLALVYGNLGDLYLDLDQVPTALGYLNRCIQQAEEYYPLVKTVYLASLGLGYAMNEQPDLALKIIEEQPLHEIENYKEEYIKALCKHIVIRTIVGQHGKADSIRQKIRRTDLSEFAADSLVKRWVNRVMKTAKADEKID